MKSRADHIRSRLQEVSGDIRATWRTALNLHAAQPTGGVHDDAECADLVNKFSDFFTDKSGASMATSQLSLEQSSHRLFAMPDRTSDRSWQPFRQWQSTRFGSCWPLSRARHRRSTSCHVPCSRTAQMSLHQSSPDSPPCRCRLERFRPGLSRPKCCHF